MAMHSTMRIELFGGLRVRLQDRIVHHFESRKAALLLVYLVLYNRSPHPREVLAELLWPEEDPDVTRNRFRQALTSLRRVLDPADGASPSALVADRSDVCLEPRSFASDVCDFETALHDVSRAADDESKLELLSRAIDLYIGELLPGYFDEWVISERERFAQEYRDALSKAADLAGSLGHNSAAIDYARRAVEADPLREDAHCALMRLYGREGRVADASRQYQELTRALREGLGLNPSQSSHDLLAEIRTGSDRLRGTSATLQDALKRNCTQSDLEPEGGAVPLDSPFYIVRPTDVDFDAALTRKDSIVLVKGARHMGKTSLVARGLQSARAWGANIVFTDFQKFTAKQLESADTLFTTLAEAMADQLSLDIPRDALWNESRGWNVNFERFIRREVLDKVDGHVIWAMDEVDRLFGLPFCDDTFGLFRSWHNERALNPSGPWGRLTLAIAFATEAHLFIRDLNQSPFNVGTRLLLEDLTIGEVTELNRRYDQPLRDRKEVSRYYDLVGGQPYLVRRGLHAMIEQGLDIEDFMDLAERDDGCYGDHLRRLFNALREDSSLCEALRAVIAGRPCPSPESFYRLRSAGVFAGKSEESARFHCRLYQQFLEHRLQ